MVQLNFNAHEVPPASPLEPLPAGKYEAIIVESGQKPNKTGTGEYLELVFQILGSGPDVPPSEEYKGRKVWARLNLYHPNPTTVKIAREELSAVCHSTGVMTPGDSSELHNLPLVIKVSLKKRDDNGELGNEVTGYEARPVAPGQSTQAAKDSPFWKRDGKPAQ